MARTKIEHRVAVYDEFKIDDDNRRKFNTQLDEKKSPELHKFCKGNAAYREDMTRVEMEVLLLRRHFERWKKQNDAILANLETYKKHAVEFQSIFGTYLKYFWIDNRFGFDVIKFDEVLIKPPDGVSTADEVLRRYGQRALDIVNELIGKKPETAAETKEHAHGQA